MRTVIKNATLIDCVQPAPVEHASVVIEDGRIAEILTGGREAGKGDSTIVDIAGAYLLPGLWDVHGDIDDGTWVSDRSRDIAR